MAEVDAKVDTFLRDPAWPTVFILRRVLFYRNGVHAEVPEAKQQPQRFPTRTLAGKLSYPLAGSYVLLVGEGKRHIPGKDNSQLFEGLITPPGPKVMPKCLIEGNQDSFEEVVVPGLAGASA